MSVADLTKSVHENPNSWEYRICLIEELVRIGEVDQAKALVRNSPTGVPMPPDFPMRIHTLFTKGFEGLANHARLPTSPAPSPAIENHNTGVPSFPETGAIPSRGTASDLPETAPRNQVLDEPAHEPEEPPKEEKTRASVLLPLLEEKRKPPAKLNLIAPSLSDPVVLEMVETEAVDCAPVEIRKADKLGAISVAAIFHLVLILLFVLIKAAVVPPDPPLLSVSSVASTDESSQESQTISRSTQRTAPPKTSSQPLISAMDFSSLSITSEFEMSFDTPLESFEEYSNEFGSTSTGAGDAANLGAIPSSMRSRCSFRERMKRLEAAGGDTSRAETAVIRGLDYLENQQDEETGGIGKSFPYAMTGLSLLAYLGHCETPDSVSYGDTVMKATLFLVNRAIENKGLIASGEKGNHQAYEHAIATYALAELHTMLRADGLEIPRLRSVLKRAVQIIVDGQKERGGWAYLGDEQEDMSVSGWNIQALKAAYNTELGLAGVESSLDKAVGRYLPSIQGPRGAFRYRPTDRDGKRTLTGAALLGMQIWGAMGSRHYNKGFDYLKTAYEDPFRENNYYAPYYNTQVFFLHGGDEWKAYNKSFQGKLLDAQESDGSWPGKGSHGGSDKKILNTTWAILMLEVYYRYLPTTDKVGDLKRVR